MEPTYDYDKFRTTYTIDKSAHPDSEVIHFCGKDRTLGEIRQHYSKFDERKYKMIIFFDDIIQYTGLGLYEVVCDLYGIKDYTIPVADYVNRKQMYGVDWVCDKVEKFNIPKEEVYRIEKEYYTDIVAKSPVSSNAEGIFRMRDILEGQMIVFRYKFSGMDKFIENVKETYCSGSYSSLEPVILNGASEESFYKQLPKSRYSYMDIVVCNDAASLLDFIIDNNINDAQILTSLDRCGLTGEEQAAYNYFEDVGPNNSRLMYLKEGI